MSTEARPSPEPFVNNAETEPTGKEKKFNVDEQTIALESSLSFEDKKIVIAALAEKLMPIFHNMLSYHRDDINDAYQNTIVRAIKYLKDFNHTSTFKTWLTRIAINEALSIRRKYKNRKKILGVDDDEAHASIIKSELADPGPSPDAKVLAGQHSQLLREALSQVDEQRRVAVLLVDFDGMKLQEAADALSLTLPALKSRLIRGRQELKQKFHQVLIPKNPPNKDNSKTEEIN